MRLILFLTVTVFQLAGQEGHGVTSADIEKGGEIFLSNCARCHGANGDSVGGVDLASNPFRRARNDSELIDIVRKGIPGTAMPPGNYTEQQAGTIVAYLHAMGRAQKTTGRAQLAGDPERGKALVESKGQCLSCHRIGNTGSVAGPDLTTIGAARSATDLETSLVNPDAEIRQNNRTVRAIDRDGRTITGMLLNQDTYSIQILDGDAKLVSLRKDRLRSFEVMKTSPMPSYRDKFSAQELADTVGYLLTLKGPA